jgi:hypothetical protein
VNQRLERYGVFRPAEVHVRNGSHDVATFVTLGVPCGPPAGGGRLPAGHRPAVALDTSRAYPRLSAGAPPACGGKALPSAPGFRYNPDSQ